MKQSLQLRLGQQLTMTPQLQQAIKLLQLSTLDLQLEVQQVLESNIMLEIADSETEENELSEFEHNEEFKSEKDAEHEVDEENLSLGENSQEMSLDNLTDIPKELAVDSEWDDIYEGTSNQYDYPNADPDNDGKDILNQSCIAPTLRDHLFWQLDLTPFSDTDRALAIAIIDSIDEDGYLRTSLEEIAQSLGEEVVIEIDEVEAVLHRIQRFDPVGVAARDLRECLLLQLDELPKDTLWLVEAKQLVEECLEILAARDYVQLIKIMKLSREVLSEIVQLIQSLNPRPGSHIESHQAAYIVPDAFVKKTKGQWRVELNPEVTPKLRINAHYASLISHARKQSDVASLKNHLQEARWFIKSLKSRHETLLRVAKCIVEKQTDFLNYGEEAMKPLVLHDIATELGLHESTISRVTTQKYIHTPRGIFELKYFFSSHVSTDAGGECSSTAIRALIRKFIAAENAEKPLSDSKIAKLLAERGIKVARRTVAKYREAMIIPPSNERKCLK